MNGLAQDGKVISVRLALYAEMMKGRPWTPSSLKEVGGTKGLGVTFLEETFSASTAPPDIAFIKMPPERCSELYCLRRAPTSRGE